ncbi:Hpt domain-containing protein [Lysobacter sp. GCM10012299]|uniref:Hpt domain-containing response regulator n=1 Tax=Lysobacter sp. GCM10012299 TaxID=3317333 RepID=UPI00361466AD
MALKVGHLLLGCTWVRTGEEAWGILQRRDQILSALIVDCTDISGYELARKVRRFDEGSVRPRLPILGLTGCSEGGEPSTCVESGMDALLPSPITLQRLCGSIWSLLRSDDSALSKIRFLGLYQTFNGDAASVCRLLRLFVLQATEDLSRLSESLRTDDSVQIKAVAHKLRSTCMMLGEASLADRLGEVESLASDGPMLAAAIESAKREIIALLDIVRKYLEEDAKGSTTSWSGGEQGSAS